MICHVQAVSPAADTEPSDVVQGSATTGKRAAQDEDAEESEYEPSGVKKRGRGRLAEGSAPHEQEAEPSIVEAEAEDMQKPKGRKVRLWHQDSHMCLSRHCMPEAVCTSSPCL